jgi:uncharacterized protein YbgA (DUF1722 family)
MKTDHIMQMVKEFDEILVHVNAYYGKDLNRSEKFQLALEMYKKATHGPVTVNSPDLVSEYQLS